MEHPTQRGIKMAVEDLYLKLHCGKVTNKIKLILFPNHIEKYDELRAELNDGEIMLCILQFYTYIRYLHIIPNRYQ